MKVYLGLFFLLITTNLQSQYVLSGKEVFTFENLPDKIEMVKRSSASIELFSSKTNRFNLIGSGFMTIIKDTIYAVTAYHVIKDKGKSVYVGYNFESRKQYSSIEKIYLDTLNDIAVMKLGIAYRDEKIMSDTSLTNPSSIGISMFEKNVKIKEGLGTIIVGYPTTLGAKYTGNKPLSRIGIVAQEPNSETNTFLIDGLVNHGNSGSPVFNEHNQKLIGMVTSFKPDYIKSRDTVVLRYPYNSGITFCVTAETILKVFPRIKQITGAKW